MVGDTENTYLKSPAGIFTTVKLPIGEIAAAVTDTIIQTKLTLQAYNQDTGNEITMAKPEEVLLVLKGEVYSFFRDNSLPDGLTSYTAELDDATNTYTFGNISALVVNAIAKARAANGGIVPPDAVEEVVVVPVTINKETINASEQVTSVRNELEPAYARLVKAGNRLEVSYITIGGKDR